MTSRSASSSARKSPRAARKSAHVAPPRVTKVSVTLTAEDEAWLRAMSKRQHRPFSIVLSEVLQQARREQAWRAFRDDALGGVPFTADEIASADSELASVFGTS